MTEGPLLIIAGPGTGKTRTLTHRIAHLVTEHGVPARHCLAITFTRRAAEEMRERLTALVPEQAPELTITTFHSLGLAILREQHERAGLNAGFGITEELTEHTPDLVDFDDLIDLPLALLEADPELAAAYRDRYRWISVDEYQDVDERQYRLLRQLATPEGNLTAIGDPDQAIYRFRGADVGFFLRFREDFPGARTVQLTRNYRSSAQVLTAAQRVIAPTTLVPGRELRPLGDHGSAPVGLHPAGGEQAEATFVARTVEELLGGATFHARDSGWAETEGAEGLGFSDFAVLYRTDRQARAVMEALTRAGLPFQKRSHDRLADRPGVPEVLAALTAGRAWAELAQDEDAVIRDAVELLRPLADRCGGDGQRLRDELALGVEVDTWDPRADRISLLTLHAAKGLEFPVVFVVGCEDGLLPLRWPGAEPDPDGEAEERRLLFVGMTRAQRRLYLSHAAERLRHGAVRPSRRSPFLARLDGLGPDTVRAAGRGPAPADSHGHATAADVDTPPARRGRGGRCRPWPRPWRWRVWPSPSTRSPRHADTPCPPSHRGRRAGALRHAGEVRRHRSTRSLPAAGASSCRPHRRAASPTSHANRAASPRFGGCGSPGPNTTRTPCSRSVSTARPTAGWAPSAVDQNGITTTGTPRCTPSAGRPSATVSVIPAAHLHALVVVSGATSIASAFGSASRSCGSLYCERTGWPVSSSSSALRGAHQRAAEGVRTRHTSHPAACACRTPRSTYCAGPAAHAMKYSTLVMPGVHSAAPVRATPPCHGHVECHPGLTNSATRPRPPPRRGRRAGGRMTRRA